LYFKKSALLFIKLKEIILEHTFHTENTCNQNQTARYLRKDVLSVRKGLALFRKWQKEFEKRRVLENPVLLSKETEDVLGVLVKKFSAKYSLFLKNRKCCSCGLKATHFALEQIIPAQQGDKFHINMYGEKDGEEILFTKDHILPKSKGGENHIDNYQTMCCPCNLAKGNQIIENKDILKSVKEVCIKQEIKKELVYEDIFVQKPTTCMYVLIKEDIYVGYAMMAIGHGVLACHLKFKDDLDYQDWLKNSYQKCICSVSNEEFNNAKAMGKHIVVRESGLNNCETALVFCPRNPKFLEKAFKKYKFWK